MKSTYGYSICVSGELIEKWLGLKEGEKILKIIVSPDLFYGFDILISSKSGWEIEEGGVFPRKKRIYAQNEN